jgi:hypothetical protein
MFGLETLVTLRDKSESPLSHILDLYHNSTAVLRLRIPTIAVSATPLVSFIA